MPFDYYRIFYYVAKYKSFSKAAKFLIIISQISLAA